MIVFFNVNFLILVIGYITELYVFKKHKLKNLWVMGITWLYLTLIEFIKTVDRGIWVAQ